MTRRSRCLPRGYHGEICAHLAEVYGAKVSKQIISVITETVLEGMSAWQNRPLDAVYPVIFIDAVNVKIRDGQVVNRPVYVALAVTVTGEGTQDCLIVVCDGLKDLPEAIAAVWPRTAVQTCIVHLLRNSFRYASKKDWSAIAKYLKPVYTAAWESDALDRFVEFSEKWRNAPGDHPAVDQRLR